MDIGSVLGEAWEIYTRFFTRLVPFAAVAFLALNLIPSALGAAVDDDAGVATVMVGLIGALVSLVGYFWLQGALTRATEDLRDGRADMTVSDLLTSVQPVLATLIIAGILAGLGIALGLLLFVVPGLYLLTRWSLIGPVVVLERRRTGEAFTRSHELVKGNGWSVFALLIILFVAAAVVGAIVSGILGGILGGFLGTWIGNTAANALVVPFTAIALTLVYFRLSEARGDAPA